MQGRPSVPKQYVLEELIGTGTFSQVWLANDTISNSKVALKIISKRMVKTPQEKTRLVREIEMHKLMEHPNIVKLLSVEDNLLNHYLVMEYIKGESLYKKVSDNQSLSEISMKHYMGQIMSAIAYLHSNLKVAHRDLKLENIMIDEHNDVKIIDFGFSKAFEQDELVTPCGSPRYVAPEKLSGKPYTQASDCWSLGVILFVCVTGKYPFDGDCIKTVAENISLHEPDYPMYLSPDLKDLLSRLLDKDPTTRIKCSDAMLHPWLNGFCLPLATPKLTQSLGKFKAKHSGNISLGETRGNGTGESALEKLVASGKFRRLERGKSLGGFSLKNIETSTDNTPVARARKKPGVALGLKRRSLAPQ